MFSIKQLEELAKQTIENADSLQVFESIDDKDGHARFVEGNGTTITATGVEYNYVKWSLSGSHLMFVLDFTLASGNALSTDGMGASYTLPQWIYNKLFPAIEPYLDAKQFDTSYNGYAISGTRMAFYIYKHSTESRVEIKNIAFDASANDNHCRVVFDFLIDNE